MTCIQCIEIFYLGETKIFKFIEILKINEILEKGLVTALFRVNPLHVLSYTSGEFAKLSF